MKMSYSSILIVLLAVAMLAISGCIGGNNNGGQATPTVSPGEPDATATPDASATPTPTQAPSTGGDTLSTLYKMGQFTWYEYQSTMDFDGEQMTAKAKYEFLGQGVDPKDGVTKEHARVTSTMNIPEVGPQTSSFDFYYDPDEADSEEDLGFTSDAVLVNEGPETVTVPAGTFACTRYSVTQDGGSNTFWSSPQAPMPVKFTATVEGDTATYELTGWG